MWSFVCCTTGAKNVSESLFGSLIYSLVYIIVKKKVKIKYYKYHMYFKRDWPSSFEDV